MAIDSSQISTEAWRYYVGLGQRYKHESVVAQGHQTRSALAKYRDVIAQDGFGAEDEQRLDDVMAGLEQSQTSKSQAVAQRDIVRLTHEETVEIGKQQRQSGLSLILAVQAVATEAGNTEVVKVARAAHSQTSLLSSDKQLLDHLSILHGAITAPVVAPVAASRNGVEIAKRILSAHGALDASLRERAGHSPVTSASEERDLLEGMAISLTRLAYTAAKATSRRTGQRSIAAAFKLTHLRRRSGGAPVAELPEPTPPAEEAPITAPITAPVTAPVTLPVALPVAQPVDDTSSGK
jgi:hypothetical protein